MGAELREQCANLTTEGPRGSSPGCLFVSTSLATWTTASPEQFARDFQINDTVYRRLDPKYYAWLRSRMVLAKKAATAGQLDPAAFEDLRVRFNVLHEWAVERFGESCLLNAIRDLDARGYRPPVAEPEAQPRAPQCVESSLPEALALVDEIRDRAFALGWTHESLYAHTGSHRAASGTSRGLIRFSEGY